MLVLVLLVSLSLSFVVVAVVAVAAAAAAAAAGWWCVVVRGGGWWWVVVGGSEGLGLAGLRSSGFHVGKKHCSELSLAAHFPT